MNISRTSVPFNGCGSPPFIKCFNQYGIENYISLDAVGTIKKTEPNMYIVTSKYEPDKVIGDINVKDFENIKPKMEIIA